jgi:hypothetical protein
MTGQRTAVFGVFHADAEAGKAVSRLTSAGFSDSDISLLESNSETSMAHLEGLEAFEAYVPEGVTLLMVRCLNSLEIDRAHTILEQSDSKGIFSTCEEPLSTHGSTKSR